MVAPGALCCSVSLPGSAWRGIRLKVSKQLQRASDSINILRVNKHSICLQCSNVFFHETQAMQNAHTHTHVQTHTHIFSISLYLLLFLFLLSFSLFVLEFLHKHTHTQSLSLTNITITQKENTSITPQVLVKQVSKSTITKDSLFTSDIWDRGISLPFKLQVKCLLKMVKESLAISCQIGRAHV